MDITVREAWRQKEKKKKVKDIRIIRLATLTLRSEHAPKNHHLETIFVADHLPSLIENSWIIHEKRVLNISCWKLEISCNYFQIMTKWIQGSYTLSVSLQCNGLPSSFELERKRSIVILKLSKLIKRIIFNASLWNSGATKLSKSQNSKCSPSNFSNTKVLLSENGHSALLGFQISKRQSIRGHAIDQASFHMTNAESLKRKFKETKLFLKAHNIQ